MALALPAVDRGAALVVSGPSGVGKSTLLAHVLARVPELSFSVSATTRPPRAGERDGVDYHFVDRPSFDADVAAGRFLEHATVYDHGYGTPREGVERALATGRSVLLDIDAQGSAQVRRALPEAVHCMVLPPSVGSLAARLAARGTDDPATIARRMAQAEAQIAAAPRYDHVVINDDLDAAKAQLLGVVLATLATPGRHARHIEGLLDAVRR